MPLKVLLTSTGWWPLSARLALRFAALGWNVQALCPAGNPLHKTRAASRIYRYSAWRPRQSLCTAVSASQPDLIVPCDDRALAHILQVQASEPDSLVAQIAAQSLCLPESHPFLQKRGELIQLARDLGLRAPEMRPVRKRADVRSAIVDFGLPVVLKTDGSWGGIRVIIARTVAEAEHACGVLTRRFSLASAVKWLIISRDPFQILPSLKRAAPQIYVQRYISGRTANIAAACSDGEYLASIQVEALHTRDAVGASTIVQTIDHPEIAETTKMLIRKLGLSGLYGLDFILEDGTGHAHLLEMNARATPTSHLALGPGRDLVAALDAKLRGRPPSQAQPVTCKSVIALFPDALLLAPNSEHLPGSYHDVPWEEPDLVRALTRLPYISRRARAALVRAPWFVLFRNDPRAAPRGSR